MEITDFEMSKWAALPIVKFPHPALKTKTKKVTAFNDELRSLVYSMLFTMYNEPGCGLSANQVGVDQCVFVTDTDHISEVGEDGIRRFVDLKPRVFINPRFKHTSGKQLCEEGCLSFPGLTVEVNRHMDVVMEFEDLNGKTMEISATDFFANCLQHENDHLEGITFLDRLSPIKRQMASKKYLKNKK